MTERWLPVGPLLAQLQGLKALGLNADQLRAEIGPLPDDTKALVPIRSYLALWDCAQRDYGKPGLPSALAGAIPFGAFGMLDYLAGSATTLGACCESLALHFSIVADDTRVELELIDTLHWLRVRVDAHVPAHVSEFTLAILAVRLRHLLGSSFVPQQVLLPGISPAGTATHQQVFGSNRVYGAPVAAMAICQADWSLPARQADPFLHDMLKGLATQLSLGHASTPALEQSLRARLRDALPSNDASPARLARLLGLSERTLQRRLADAGRNFSAVVDDFRHEESIRLLSDPQLALVHVAATLGFSEQTSFTRAFKRWTGTTPAAWRTRQRG